MLIFLLSKEMRSQLRTGVAQLQRNAKKDGGPMHLDTGPSFALPEDADRAILVGRAFRPEVEPFLLAPIDLQAVKAAGVTFAVSLLERVIEEQARGAPERAAAIRARDRRR
jgi:fumarylacetoacetate (FAA) hydrolase family protein